LLFQNHFPYDKVLKNFCKGKPNESLKLLVLRKIKTIFPADSFTTNIPDPARRNYEFTHISPFWSICHLADADIQEA